MNKLAGNLAELKAGLENGAYPIGDYHRFTIHDPKEREICAARFGERVLHYALMNICEPYFDKWLSPLTYACRKDKGQLAAVARAQMNAAKFAWFLKCDFKKYFDSIPHEELKHLLRTKFKDARLLAWFDRLIDTYETEKGKGLPIGNLTSQHFANLYLDRLDRFLKPQKGRRGYVRYMDDFIVWSNDKELQERETALTAFLQHADTLCWRRRFNEIDLGHRRVTSGSNRVKRGGSWNNNAQNCRSANRNNNTPSNTNNNNGFRLCCSAALAPTRRQVPADVLSVSDRGENSSPAVASSNVERCGRAPLISKGRSV